MDRANHRRRRASFVAATSIAFALTMGAFPAHARGCVAQVDVHDRAQSRTLAEYRKFGRRWITGEPGHEYELRIRNCSDARVLAVISVDGVNAISGETASPSQSGYVLEPGEHLTVEGWRKSMEHTAAFVFTDPSDSYAARTGRPHDLGVIGVALFREARPAVVAREPVAQAHAPPATRAEGAAEAESAPSASKSSADASGVNRAASLGTGHGRSEHSPARWTSFERASSTPDETISIRYETRASLVALGVLPRGRLPDRNPDPFPAQVGFVPDP